MIFKSWGAQSIKVPNRLWLQFLMQCKSFNHCDTAN